VHAGIETPTPSMREGWK